MFREENTYAFANIRKLNNLKLESYNFQEHPRQNINQTCKHAEGILRNPYTYIHTFASSDFRIIYRYKLSRFREFFWRSQKFILTKSHFQFHLRNFIPATLNFHRTDRHIDQKHRNKFVFQGRLWPNTQNIKSYSLSVVPSYPSPNNRKRRQNKIILPNFHAGKVYTRKISELHDSPRKLILGFLNFSVLEGLVFYKPVFYIKENV